jgi:hypothetical protein
MVSIFVKNTLMGIGLMTISLRIIEKFGKKTLENFPTRAMLSGVIMGVLTTLGEIVGQKEIVGSMREIILVIWGGVWGMIFGWMIILGIQQKRKKEQERRNKNM